jgi:hypothetical protein
MMNWFSEYDLHHILTSTFLWLHLSIDPRSLGDVADVLVAATYDSRVVVGLWLQLFQALLPRDRGEFSVLQSWQPLFRLHSLGELPLLSFCPLRDLSYHGRLVVAVMCSDF